MTLRLWWCAACWAVAGTLRPDSPPPVCVKCGQEMAACWPSRSPT